MKISQKTYLFTILLILSFLNSCSTIKDLAFKKRDDLVKTDISEDFHLKKDKEILEKFKDHKVTSNNTKNKKVKKKRKTIKRSIASVSSKSKEVTFDEYEHFWTKSRPIVDVGEFFVFEVSYFGITAGHVKLTTESEKVVNGEPRYHFNASMRSARFYSTLYSLDDSIDSYLDKKSFLPVKYVLTQRESGQSVDDLQIFDHDKNETHVFYKRLKKGKKKTYRKIASIPTSFHDSYSAIHFVRSFPLRVGDKYEFPVITRGKKWILKVDTLKHEFIKIMGEKIKAVKIKAETHYPGVLEKKGDIHFWFSADKHKKLLKFDAKVKIGTVTGDLVEYQKGKFSKSTSKE
jgi:hypothetical protein